MKGKRIQIFGVVQGVGFRPYVYNLAGRFDIKGTVKNDAAGVDIRATGPRLEEFIEHLTGNPPPLSIITDIRITDVELAETAVFSIVESAGGGLLRTEIGVDTAVCEDCLREMMDPADRRYLYEFTNCVNCGPRYTIISGGPYDRARTSMADFDMCDECRSEYENPRDRRYHCQSNCCPRCGPRYNDVDRAIDVLKSGGIVAVKGIGGYHLACDAENHDAVRRLRRRKHRDEKPFAVMVLGTAGLHLSADEERLMSGVERPILLLKKDYDTPVAPKLGTIGVMLAYAPVHFILFHKGGFNALVMTSGNRTDEPIAIENGQAYLGHIADFVLDHNRRICMRNDDSVIREMGGRPVFIRRSRGYAPGAIGVDFDASNLLGCGAMLKNTIALGRGGRVYMSQHIGDLQNEETYRSLERTAEHMKRMFSIEPDTAVCDLHPDYLSTHYAESLGLPVVKVQHHVAHAYACLSENRLRASIAVVYDGVGYGEDGLAWGGEIFLVSGKTVEREAHWSYLPMIGGDACVRYPLRLAAGALRERGISLPGQEEVLELADKQVNVAYTSGLGRLFDAASALLGICTEQTYEGQAPMEMEGACAPLENAGCYDASGLSGGALLEQLYRDKSPVDLRAARFHNSIIEATTGAVLESASKTGQTNVCLTGGCFQNLLLLEGLMKKLNKHLKVYTHRLVPPNDGGLALGQIAKACFDREE
jgi:hydrogenase maturation protein HypF